MKIVPVPSDDTPNKGYLVRRVRQILSLKSCLAMHRPLYSWIILAASVGLFACGVRPSAPPTVTPVPQYPPGQKPYEQNGVWYYPLPSSSGYIEEGIASWYGSEFHDRPTSSGEPYDMEALTAAHKILPLGTHVKVTNLRNAQSLILRINDRGPFVAGRSIDLSRNAARRLGVLQAGTAPVRIEAIQVASATTTDGITRWQPQPVPDFRHGKFAIQVGAFQSILNALRLKKGLEGEFETVFIQPGSNYNDSLYRVHAGFFSELTTAETKARWLKQRGFSDAFVVAIDDTRMSGQPLNRYSGDAQKNMPTNKPGRLP